MSNCAIYLPLSKSIANRLLILQALHGDPLLEVSAASDPDDVVLLHDVLQQVLSFSPTPCPSWGRVPEGRDRVFSLGNCGTAMRFLTAFCATREGLQVTLDGVARMRQRPIGQLVDALNELGADITYLGEEGYPPLLIRGRKLAANKVEIRQPQSTQFVSALLLCGIEVETDVCSPYISMTRRMVADTHYSILNTQFEKCWSSAAFWYEYVALHGGSLALDGLHEDSLQGDKVVADIFRQLGVATRFTEEGATITRVGAPADRLEVDFRETPDLYPAVALACERLGVTLTASGTESLRLKESDRLEAVARHEVRDDHRMAMALLCADYPVAESERTCIRKSYPTFSDQFKNFAHPQDSGEFNSPLAPVGERGRGKGALSHITPRRGINDDNLGKKHALRKLITAADTEFVWLHDDDITLPPASDAEAVAAIGDADMLILPLIMEGKGLQQLEYAALQELTVLSAEKGYPVMCSGANMVVRRSAWLDSMDDLHPELPSGDDMFLLESFKRKGRKIITSRDPRLEAVVYPVKGLRAFLRQRMRWAGKAPAYRDHDILLCGWVVTVAAFLQLLCPLLVLVFFPLEYHLLRRRMGDAPIARSFVLALIYPYYMLLCLVGGLFRRKQW